MKIGLIVGDSCLTYLQPDYNPLTIKLFFCNLGSFSLVVRKAYMAEKSILMLVSVRKTHSLIENNFCINFSFIEILQM